MFEKPKHEDNFFVCNCHSDEVNPAKGEIEYQATGGGTIKKKKFWCMNCGLTLRQPFIDKMGEPWKDTRKDTVEQKKADEPYDPMKDDSV